MSFFGFIYPRTISVSRPIDPANLSYSELNYSPVTGLSNLIASIQYGSISGVPNTQLPGDASNETYWDIYIPFAQGLQSGVIANGLILLRDKIIDDQSLQYEVVAPYWDSLGYKLRCKLLSP